MFYILMTKDNFDIYDVDIHVVMYFVSDIS